MNKVSRLDWARTGRKSSIPTVGARRRQQCVANILGAKGFSLNRQATQASVGHAFYFDQRIKIRDRHQKPRMKPLAPRVKTNAHKMQNNPFTLSSSVTHLRPELTPVSPHGEFAPTEFARTTIQLGRFPFDQNFRNFRSETEWKGKNSGKSFRKFRNTF